MQLDKADRVVTLCNNQNQDRTGAAHIHEMKCLADDGSW